MTNAEVQMKKYYNEIHGIVIRDIPRQYKTLVEGNLKKYIEKRVTGDFDLFDLLEVTDRRESSSSYNPEGKNDGFIEYCIEFDKKKFSQQSVEERLEIFGEVDHFRNIERIERKFNDVLSWYAPAKPIPYMECITDFNYVLSEAKKCPYYLQNRANEKVINMYDNLIAISSPLIIPYKLVIKDKLPKNKYVY